jgi:hypothetical protein
LYLFIFIIILDIFENQTFTQAESFFDILFPFSDDFEYLKNKLCYFILSVDEKKQPTIYKKLLEK